MLGAAKALNIDINTALYDISFVNIMLYSRAAPMYGDEDESNDKPMYDESKDACNIDNFTNCTDDELIV